MSYGDDASPVVTNYETGIFRTPKESFSKLISTIRDEIEQRVESRIKKLDEKPIDESLKAI